MLPRTRVFVGVISERLSHWGQDDPWFNRPGVLRRVGADRHRGAGDHQKPSKATVKWIEDSRRLQRGLGLVGPFLLLVTLDL